uniref:Cystatin domain-containing protein n=1 Tax=Graphocephala atropunctata TaxID=36148 RepID=A0A1B6LT23_9HEMI
MNKAVLLFCPIIFFVTGTVSDVIPGGWVDADPQYPRIQEVAAYAVKAGDENSHCDLVHALFRVSKAQTQVVAGINYLLKIYIVRTNCTKGEETKPCAPLPESQVKTCEAKVYEHFLGDQRDLIKYECSPAICFSGSLQGGLNIADSEDPKVQDRAKYATSELDKLSNSTFNSKLLRVEDAMTQAVSGFSYDLTLKIAETHCLKSHMLPGCDVPPYNRVQHCSVVVLDRPGNIQNLLKHSCRDASPPSSSA